jgi:hypothetical protein
MLGSVLRLIGIDLKRQVRETVMTIVFALLGAILILLALGFGIAALYEWLKLQHGTLPALGILGGAWAALGIVFFILAFYRPKGRTHTDVKAVNLQEPAAAIVQAAEQAVNNASGVVREGSRKQMFGALLIAAVAGFLIGRRL